MTLIRDGKRIALVDTGNFGMRKLLIEQLALKGLKPSDITDIPLTHSHYDHSVNRTLFRHARIVIGKVEMEWALNEPWGETPVPELYVAKLAEMPNCVQVNDGDEIFPNMIAHLVAEHTPGCLMFHCPPQTGFHFHGRRRKKPRMVWR